MLDLLFILLVFNVIVILLVPENVWLTIHRNVRKWVKQLVGKAKNLGD